MNRIYVFFFVLKASMCGCGYDSRHSKSEKLEKNEILLGKMSAVINESSGITNADRQGFYFTHNDSGGKPEIYELDALGQCVDTVFVKNASNIDWEDITKDTKGNYYLSDLGNNSQKRKDLAIYRFNGITAEKINIKYADQKTEEKNFDCEAVFWYQNSLYLFTKVWDKHNKVSKMYVVPDQPGNYDLEPRQKVKMKAQITGAALSPDQSEFALLCYGKILLFKINNQKIDFEHPQKCIKIHRSQSEGIVYESQKSLIYTNEQGEMYRVKI